MNAIIVDKLTKKFNGFTAVDELSFNVETGELFGLLGPNGAGKTTTINLLSTLLMKTSGTAQVAGTTSQKPATASERASVSCFRISPWTSD